jgi:phosphopantothenoylcysteine decarboxylase/phosphopantothenate--cysteine ligase
LAIKKKQEIRDKRQGLRGKRILITAGPTWVPIDSVRVISNIATGETGILLAKQAQEKGAQVTLFLGNSSIDWENKSINICGFKFFKELRSRLIKELRLRQYDIIIHSAAVSDFRPNRQYPGKLNSGKAVSLKLSPLPKIIKDIRGLAPLAKLVMFKLETGVPDRALIQRAKRAQIKAGADFIVANRINPYRAFIINDAGKIYAVSSKVKLASQLLGVIKQ